MFLSEPSIICALGIENTQIYQGLTQAKAGSLTGFTCLDGKQTKVGKVHAPLKDIPLNLSQYTSRNTQLALTCVEPLLPEVEKALTIYGKQRVAIVIGSSTSGISEGEKALTQYYLGHGLPRSYQYQQQEIGATCNFLAELLGISPLNFSVSTACSSGAKAVASAARLIRHGICDAAIVGGVDSLCEMTVSGFSALESISDTVCNPFSRNRCGINIGEAAAFFLMTRTEQKVRLAGVGESSDAYHISSPKPDGEGAIRAMEEALQKANIHPFDIDYINLHGTATIKNDEMESLAVNSIFGNETLCSSTKPFTGHTLGAAGAIELAFCVLSMRNKQAKVNLPVHLYDGEYDQGLARLNLVKENDVRNVRYALSNSFAFGGSNISLIVENYDY